MKLKSLAGLALLTVALFFAACKENPVAVAAKEVTTLHDSLMTQGAYVTTLSGLVAEHVTVKDSADTNAVKKAAKFAPVAAQLTAAEASMNAWMGGMKPAAEWLKVPADSALATLKAQKEAGVALAAQYAEAITAATTVLKEAGVEVPAAPVAAAAEEKKEGASVTAPAAEEAAKEEPKTEEPAH